MLDRSTGSNFPTLTCSNCGKASHFRVPGVTAQTRYTCPQCCERILLQRGVCPNSSNPYALREESEVRQFALQHESYGNLRSRADDFS